jgi:hypothetical protein
MSTAAETTLSQIAEYLHIDLTAPLPIEIPNTTRHTLAALLAHLGFRIGVEVGVESGRYARTLFHYNPSLKLYGVDPWESYDGYRGHVSIEHQNELLARAKGRLAEYDWTPIRKFSMDAARDFADESLDFVYIDGNHNFLNTTQDLDAWSRKVRKGGIISGHDFKQRSQLHGKQRGNDIHVVEVVTAWTTAYEIDPWFVFGRSNPEPNEISESSRSFMWVKE